jgi:hypothetical protein
MKIFSLVCNFLVLLPQLLDGLSLPLLPFFLRDARFWITRQTL